LGFPQLSALALSGGMPKIIEWFGSSAAFFINIALLIHTIRPLDVEKVTDTCLMSETMFLSTFKNVTSY